jgi:hypothetical protein
MNEHAANKPPLDIEQAIDLILAVPSMFSTQNEAQREFGKIIVAEYFIKLREENKNDLRAYKYLVNLFTAISSAVRAFGVQRSIFSTKWQTLIDLKDEEIKSAKRITSYSPFRGDKFWNRFVGFIMSIGGGGSAFFATAKILLKGEYSFIIFLAFFVFGGVIGIIALDILLEKMKNNRVNNIISKYPDDLSNKWKSENISKYKEIIKSFLISAIKIREEFYPELSTINDKKVFTSDIIKCIQFSQDCQTNSEITIEDVNTWIDDIVNRHFAF